MPMYKVYSAFYFRYATFEAPYNFPFPFNRSMFKTFSFADRVFFGGVLEQDIV